MSLQHLKKKQASPACGNCKHFVAGGKCTLVQGGIEVEMLCDFFEVGLVQPMYSEVDPPYTKHESNYRPLSFQEAIGNVDKIEPEFQSQAMGHLVNSILEREHFLVQQGIPEPEVQRVVANEFSRLLNVNENDWVNQPQENTLPAIRPEVPDTGYPPVLPFPVFAVTSPFDNVGFDGKNPDPPEVDPNVIIKDESYYRQPGYAGGRDVENLTQYQTDAPGNSVIKSQAYPYDNQHAKNYIDAPFKEPAYPSMHNEYPFVVKKSIPEWQYNIEDDQTGILQELTTETDKTANRVKGEKLTKSKIKHGTTKGNKSKSMAPIMDQARADYLHGNKNKPGDPIEMPYMVVSSPELPGDPHEVVDKKLEEAISKHRQQKDISLEDIPGDTPEEKKATKKSRLAILAPWLLLLGGVAGAGYFLSQPKDQFQLLAKFTYHGHEFPEICEGYDGRTFDLLNKNNRPVPPSEGLGYTNTHPNCKCTWEFVKGIANKPSFTTQHERDHIKDVNREINKASKKGELHKVEKTGGLSKQTYKTNFRKIQETVEQIRQDFDWLSDEYLERVKSVNAPGRMFLIRASSEAITDHRPDGEPLRRWLKPDELHAMARTAVGMSMDINHHVENRTNSHILDSEFNKNRNEIQMIIHEEDPEVLQAIAKGDISAVSINGGAPRSEKVECPDCDTGSNCECFIVPEGVILGELDNIALTWVVTNPRGMMFKGRWIAPATPGVKVTAIEPL